ncbi:MAG: hypothetical protein ACKVRP_10840 [Bacteroidota bacterium]
MKLSQAVSRMLKVKQSLLETKRKLSIKLATGSTPKASVHTLDIPK